MMSAAPWIQIYTARNMMTSSHHPLHSNELHSHIYLPPKSRERTTLVKASGQIPPPSSSERRNPIVVVLDIPKTIWKRTLRPLSDFGFGKRSIWEGGIGLFVVSGAVVLALSLVWLREFQLRSRFRKYQAVFEFSQACGISLGTPVRIRGVTVGTVVRVNSDLKSVDAVVEVEDDKIIIPRNSLVEVNQSGLLMETLIDITPQDPLPTPTAGPLDPECIEEGMIVCDKEKIRGKQGVSLDALVGIFTRLGREVEEIGVARSYALAEKVAAVVLEAQPLLSKIETMAEDIQPTLADVRASALIEDVKSLTNSLAEATKDLRNAQTSMLTQETAETFRDSVTALILTLKNIESITSDVSDFTGDEATRKNMKMLIKSLSRLM